jgi:hypothetical protein
MSFVVIRDPRLGGHNHPTVVHVNRADAVFEAKRLAAQNRGTLFLVASLVAGCQLPEPEATVEEYSGSNPDPWDDEVPF